jgi:hypothetical protein
MSLSDAQVKKLLEFKGTPKINQLSLNMALTRLKMTYKSNPAALSQCTKEINTLLGKYASILEADYRWIASL